MRIGIIGSGIAGLSCADTLTSLGHEVRLFDKGRGPGGRMSARRVEVSGRTLSFDHGAQYFTVRDDEFNALVGKWEREGHAVRWRAAGPEAWVGAPAMNAPVRALAANHDVSWSTQVQAIERVHNGWQLIGDPHTRSFDVVVAAVPAEQAAPLLARHVPRFAEIAVSVTSAPCWTLMAAFAEPLEISCDVLRSVGPISWAARNSGKPGRVDIEAWVVQASPEWTAQHLEEKQEEVAFKLMALFKSELAIKLPAPLHISSHRWRYARSGAADGPIQLWDAEAKLGVCGDWLLAPRVEAAWLSGRRLGAVINSA